MSGLTVSKALFCNRRSLIFIRVRLIFRRQGFNVDGLEVESARIVERVVLEQKFGMLLSEVGTPFHVPRWRVYRPECHEWILAGTVEVEGVGALDHSPNHDKQDPLSSRPHLEYSARCLATMAADFPVAHDSSKRLAVSAVEFRFGSSEFVG